MIQSISEKVRAFEEQWSTWTLRERVKHLAVIRGQLDDLGVATLHEGGVTGTSAVARLIAYFKLHVGTVIDGDELAVVAGIQDYPRRIRELRGQSGYQILSGADSDPESGLDLRPDQYVLLSDEPDTAAVNRWRLANTIRRGTGGSKAKILEFLIANVGQVVTTEELRYVSDDAAEFGRRTREIRTELGYQVATRFTGRPDLAPGQYVLQSLDRLYEPHDRHIPFDVQKAVYLRDRNTCRCCGWSQDNSAEDRPRLLELHHVEHHARGGANSEDNLIVLCSKCHDEVHAGRLVESPSSGGEISFVPAASLERP